MAKDLLMNTNECTIEFIIVLCTRQHTKVCSYREYNIKQTWFPLMKAQVNCHLHYSASDERKGICFGAPFR